MTQPVQPQSDIELLEARVEKLEDLIKKYKGIDNPFICGGTTEKGEDGLPDMIFVCPLMGADGFAIYKKYKDYSAPGY